MNEQIDWSQEIADVFDCSRYDNQIAIIAMLRIQGATIELGDTGKMWARVPAGSLSEEQIIGLKSCREGLTHALRVSEGYCGVCGTIPATRPMKMHLHSKEKCLFCEECFWNTVNPITHRLGLTDAQRKREEKQNDRQQTANDTDLHSIALSSLF